MKPRLTDRHVKALPIPEKGSRITYDGDVKGFGVRVTAGGAISFILNYRTRAGTERRFTIGSFPDWTSGAARDEARELKKAIDRGEDPMGAEHQARVADTVGDLCDRFIEQYLPKKRESTQRDYIHLIEREIRPALGSKKVANVDFSDVDALHRKITRRGATYQANRTIAVASKMFSLAIKWKMRGDNPAKGIERNHEDKRKTYLSGAQLVALSKALTEHPDRQAANILRLLLLTGARRGEALAARWEQFDLETGIWTKPGATTKQKTDHRVPLSSPARQLLAEIRSEAEPDAVFVFPGNGKVGHRHTINKNWAVIRKAAAVPTARIHDLRHTYASVLASSGMSLPIIGALLGHTQPATTARYAHLLDDPLRQATETAGAIVTGHPSGQVVPIKGRP